MVKRKVIAFSLLFLLFAGTLLVLQINKYGSLTGYSSSSPRELPDYAVKGFGLSYIRVLTSLSFSFIFIFVIFMAVRFLTGYKERIQEEEKRPFHRKYISLDLKHNR